MSIRGGIERFISCFERFMSCLACLSTCGYGIGFDDEVRVVLCWYKNGMN